MGGSQLSVQAPLDVLALLPTAVAVGVHTAAVNLEVSKCPPILTVGTDTSVKRIFVSSLESVWVRPLELVTIGVVVDNVSIVRVVHVHRGYYFWLISEKFCLESHVRLGVNCLGVKLRGFPQVWVNTSCNLGLIASIPSVIH